MYYVHKNVNPSRKSAYYYVKDFSGGIESGINDRILPLAYAAESVNFSVKSGALCDGGGVKQANFSGNKLSYKNVSAKPLRLYYFKTYNQENQVYENRVLAYFNDGYVYQTLVGKTNEFEKISELNFTKAPASVRYNYNGKNVIIFSGGEDMKIFDGESVEVVSDAPVVTSMCMHGERLFATEAGEKTMLWYSDDFDPANWDVSLSEAGFIDLRDERGTLLKVLELGGYVYVFRNYGITRITAYGDQTEFCADGLCSSSGRIFGGSITLCGDKIAYLAEDGFYCFSGGTPVKFLTKLEGLLKGVDNSGAKGVYFNGELFVNLKIKFKSGIQDCVLRYNFAQKSTCILSGFNVVDFEVYDGEGEYRLLFLTDGVKFIGELSESTEFFGLPVFKSWQSGFSDLGKPETEKTLRGVTLYSNEPVKLTVTSECGSASVNFSGEQSDEYVKIALKGKAFRFLIESSKPNSVVARLKIDFEYGIRGA